MVNGLRLSQNVIPLFRNIWPKILWAYGLEKLTYSSQQMLGLWFHEMKKIKQNQVPAESHRFSVVKEAFWNKHNIESNIFSSVIYLTSNTINVFIQINPSQTDH